MDFRKIKAGMRVVYKSSTLKKKFPGTVQCVYNVKGLRYFDILFDNSVYGISYMWCKHDRDSLDFSIAQYREDFDKLIKKRKKCQKIK